MFLIENSSNDLKPFYFITGGARIGPRRIICDQKRFGDCIRASTTSFRYWKVLIPMACSAMNTCSDTSSGKAEQKSMAGSSRLFN